MDKTLVFKWIALVENDKSATSLYQEDLSLNHTHIKASLPLVVDLVKQVETFENVSLSLGSGDNRIFIDGLTTPIRLIERANAGHFFKETILTGTGPSLKWLLENTTETNNPNPNKLLYTDDMVVRFEPFKDEGTTITFLRVDDAKHILKTVGDSVIEWLSYEAFNTFLASYGYTNEVINNDIAFILMMYKATKELGFKDPKEVISHFCDKRLVAELALKGVFEKLLKD